MTPYYFRLVRSPGWQQLSGAFWGGRTAARRDVLSDQVPRAFKVRAPRGAHPGRHRTGPAAGARRHPMPGRERTQGRDPVLAACGDGLPGGLVRPGQQPWPGAGGTTRPARRRPAAASGAVLLLGRAAAVRVPTPGGAITTASTWGSAASRSRYDRSQGKDRRMARSRSSRGSITTTWSTPVSCWRTRMCFEPQYPQPRTPICIVRPPRLWHDLLPARRRRLPPENYLFHGPDRGCQPPVARAVMVAPLDADDRAIHNTTPAG